MSVAVNERDTKMSNCARLSATKRVAALKAGAPCAAQEVTDIGYADDVFTRETMKTYLSKETYKKLLKTIDGGQPLDETIAGEVAHAMRHWAQDRGANVECY